MIQMDFTIREVALLDGYYYEQNSDSFEEEINNYKDVIRHLRFLKYCTPSEKLAGKLIEIVRDKVENKKRYQRLNLWMAIAHHSYGVKLSSKTRDQLFELYKKLILIEQDEVCWKISKALKGVELEEEQVNWLIEYSDNSFVLNRILRYPCRNETISKWCKQCFEGQYMFQIGRIAEYLSWVVDTESDSFFSHPALKPDNIVWALYYSRIENEGKQRLLLDYLCHDNFDDFMEVCRRLGFKDLILSLRNQAYHQMDG